MNLDLRNNWRVSCHDNATFPNLTDQNDRLFACRRLLNLAKPRTLRKCCPRLLTVSSVALAHLHLANPFHGKTSRVHQTPIFTHIYTYVYIISIHTYICVCVFKCIVWKKYVYAFMSVLHIHSVYVHLYPSHHIPHSGFALWPHRGELKGTRGQHSDNAVA